jgi:Ca-activated chloride channel family protein
MSALGEFHFLRPLALLALLLLPLFWLVWRAARSEAGAWRGVVDAHLLPHLLERVGGGADRSAFALAALLWTLACIALAGPAWEREPMPLYHNQAARVLAIELAPTMYAQDEKPNRLARARFKLDDILARSRDHQTALIGYAGDAFVAAPLTDDVGTVRNLIDALDPGTMPVTGNDAARAIAAGVELIAQAGLHRGEVVLLADAVGPDAAAAARKALSRGVTVSVLGIGTAAGAPVPLPQGDFLKDDDGNMVVARLDEAALRAVADAGGGRYATLSADARDLDALLPDRVDVAQGADAGEHAAQSTRWRDRGPWLLLLLLPLALLGFRRGWLMALVLVVVAPVQPARAAGFEDLWRRPDQQAAHALEQGDAQRAAGVAAAPEWRAGAAYRAGDYEAALREYERAGGGADGVYNKGNALAKLGRYDEAISAYDEALRLAPEMADAKSNRQAVEEFLKQQQEQKQNSPSGQQDSDQNSKKPQQGEQKSPSQQDQGGTQGGQGEQAEQQDSQQGKEGKPQPGEGQPQEGDSKKDADESSSQAKPQDGGDERKQGAQQAQAGAPDAEQRKALSKEIDQALADPAKKGDEEATAHGMAEEDDAAREKKQALEHWLQRVPDDPGGLLRRKFQLEYQRRQQRGGDEP